MVSAAAEGGRGRKAEISLKYNTKLLLPPPAILPPLFPSVSPPATFCGSRRGGGKRREEGEGISAKASPQAVRGGGREPKTTKEKSPKVEEEEECSVFFPWGKTECLGPFDALRNFAGQIAFHFEAIGERQQTPFSLFPWTEL